MTGADLDNQRLARGSDIFVYLVEDHLEHFECVWVNKPSACPKTFLHVMPSAMKPVVCYASFNE